MSNDDLKKIGDLIDTKLESINRRLDDPKNGLVAINKRLDDPDSGLKTMKTQLDDITAELFEVHKLAGSTYDLVRLEPQKRRQEINEIREYMGLPTIPIEK